MTGDQIEVFNILNGSEDIDRNISRRTRRHEVTLAKAHCRLDVRNVVVSQRRVNRRNRLSVDYVGTSSVNVFKDKHSLIFICSVTPWIAARWPWCVRIASGGTSGTPALCVI